MVKRKAEAAGGLDRSVSHLLHRALQRALDIYGQQGGPGAITQRQYVVLAAVGAEEGVTQTALVKATGIDRSTLADLVSRMIDKGLLARERSSADARANAVRLTQEGREALKAATPQAAAVDEAILTLLPGSKRDALLKALETIAAGKPRRTRADKDERKQAKAAKKLAKKVKKQEAAASGSDAEPEEG